jgi:hypothetical protein
MISGEESQMNIASIGKALAGQAIEGTKNAVVDAMRDTQKPAVSPGEVKPTAVDTGAVILGQIQAMQRPLQADQELLVLFRAGDEMLRVTEIFVPNTKVLVFAGADPQGNVTRVIAPVDSAQVVCKIVKTPQGAAPVRINVLTPKPRPEPVA